VQSAGGGGAIAEEVRGGGSLYKIAWLPIPSSEDLGGPDGGALLSKLGRGVGCDCGWYVRRGAWPVATDKRTRGSGQKMNEGGWTFLR